MSRRLASCYVCNQLSDEQIEFTSAPLGETHFQNTSKLYPRKFVYCANCVHWTSSLIDSVVIQYESEYAESTYGSDVKERYQRIIDLPIDRSDNRQRVKWITSAVSESLSFMPGMRLLDVGSGLGVFPHVMSGLGWNVLGVEPNIHLCLHLRNLREFGVHEGDLNSLGKGELFQLITLNKVLEHIQDPIATLVETQRFLEPAGLLYLEVPDGEEASRHGFGREEFFVEHLHVFSMLSAMSMVRRAGYQMVKAAKVVEPSGKFTLRILAHLE